MVRGATTIGKPVTITVIGGEPQTPAATQAASDPSRAGLTQTALRHALLELRRLERVIQATGGISTVMVMGLAANDALPTLACHAIRSA